MKKFSDSSETIPSGCITCKFFGRCPHISNRDACPILGLAKRNEMRLVVFVNDGATDIKSFRKRTTEKTLPITYN